MAAGTESSMKGRERAVFSQPDELENAASRLFHAPIDRVFRVFTDPLYAPSIWAENPADVKVEEMDVRPGGRFSILVRNRDGSTTGFSGEYLEIVPPRRIVNTFLVTDLPGTVAVETDEFEPVGDRTRLRVRWRFASRKERDGMYGPEFERSIETAWAAVDRLLESMR